MVLKHLNKNVKKTMKKKTRNLSKKEWKERNISSFHLFVMNNRFLSNNISISQELYKNCEKETRKEKKNYNTKFFRVPDCVEDFWTISKSISKIDLVCMLIAQDPVSSKYKTYNLSFKIWTQQKRVLVWSQPIGT